MSQYCALLSIIFMIGFVVLFDSLHLSRRNVRFCANGLLSRNEVDRILQILTACQDG